MKRVILLLAARCAAMLACGLIALSPAAARADPVVQPASLTNLASTADRVISYRNQQHLWQTADGWVHVLMNRGGTGGGSLVLQSSADGMQWVAGPVVSGTGGTSTSDGHLDPPDLLSVAYSDASGAVRFTRFVYASATHTWTQLASEPVYGLPGQVAASPAMAQDAQGRRWLAFTRLDLAANRYAIRLFVKPTEVSPWSDTGVSFAVDDATSNERSARPVATPTGMGMVYTLHENLYWTQRSSSWPLSASWTTPKLIVSSQVADVDPYGSHFSVAVDPGSNVHVASVDGGRLVYSRLLASTQAWATRALTDNVSATYTEIVLANNAMAIVTNSKTVLTVLQSRDAGATFAVTHTLTHPPATAAVTYDRPRMASPVRTSGPFPVLQQYQDGATQRLMYFGVSPLQ